MTRASNLASPPMTDVTSASTDRPLSDLRMADREHWLDGPPHETFARVQAPYYPGMFLLPLENLR